MCVVNSFELLGREVSYFPNVRCVKPWKDISIKEFLHLIQSSKLEEQISEIREAREEEERKKKKKKLPCVSLSGLGNRDRSKEHNTFRHSGLLQLDFDIKDQEISSEEIKKFLSNDPHVLACFYSPSGGVKAIVPIKRKESTHTELFNMAKEHFKTVYDIVADGSPKSPYALCYLSHDPNVFIADGEVQQFDLTHKENRRISSCSSTHSTHSTHSHPVTQKKGERGEERINGFERLKNKKLIKTAEQKWRNHPDTASELIELWELIERRFVPNFGERNKILCDFIPFAHRRMSKKMAISLAKEMRFIWDAVCSDSVEQHIREAESLWRGCEITFQNEFNFTEKQFYDELSDEMEYLRATFRICRDLSYFEVEGLTQGTFFLSCRELGKRIGKTHKYASFLLNELCEFEIIECIQVGKMSGRKASEYRWLLT